MKTRSIARAIVALLLGALLTGSLAAAAAQAVPVARLGVCSNVGAGNGSYKDSKCQTGQEKGEFQIQTPAKSKFTIKGGADKLIVFGGIEMPCKASKGSAELSSTTTVKHVSLTFEECEIQASGKVCHFAPITLSAKGEIGNVATTQAASGVGLLFEEETKGAGLALIAANECLGETRITGTIAGEVAGVEGKEFKLAFALATNKQKIKEVELASGAKVKPSLKAYGLEMMVESSETLKFEEALTLGAKV